MGMIRGGMVVWLLLVGAARGEVTPGMELERKVIDYRNQIAHGRVVFVVQSTRTATPGGPVGQVQYAIEFDGPDIRCDMVDSRFSRPLEFKASATAQQVINVLPDGVRQAVPAVAPAAWRENLFSPRLIGVANVPVSMLDAFTLEESLGFADRRNETIADEEINGIPVKHVSYDREVGSHIDLWIAPDRGFALLKYVARDEQTEQILTGEYGQYSSGIWYPRQIEWTEKNADGQVTEQEVVIVESADFSYEPAEERFQIASFDLPPGTEVTDNGTRRLWNGNRLETPGENRARQVEQAKQEQQSRSWWPYAAAGLAMVAVGLFVWHRRAVVGIVALLALYGNIHAAEATPGMELELKLLEYRQQLDHGKVVLKVETLAPVSRPHSTEYNGRYKIEFDGNQIRSEYQTEDYPIGPHRRILTSDQIIVMSHDFSSILDLDQVVSSGSLDVLNPTLLGAAQGPVAILDNWTLEERLAYPDRSNETVTDEMLDGIPVKRISYDRSIGNHFDIWIAPSMGHAILKRMVTSDDGSVATMSCDCAEYPPGVWFPSRVEQQQTSAEGELVEHEIATVESADFAYRPDEVRFSLLSLDLPVGKSVNDNGIRKVWNGRELEMPGAKRARQVEQVKAEQRRAEWWPWAAAGLAVAAVGLRLFFKVRTACGRLMRGSLRHLS
ncbi:MAG: hypothetical protein ACF8TS_21495 [Maioricimonas sp. JB049]